MEGTPFSLNNVLPVPLAGFPDILVTGVLEEEPSRKTFPGNRHKRERVDLITYPTGASLE